MKQVEVTILGQTYILGCPDDGQSALQQAVGMVDREMCAIRDAGKIKARERIAVLAALNLAYRLAEMQVELRTAREAVAAGGGGAGGAAPPGASSATGALPLADPDMQALIDNVVNRLDSMLAEDGRLL
jgi:cell division protein ZapA